MTKNIDSSEVEKFADLAQRWWDPQGEFKPLHIICLLYTSDAADE